MDEIKRVISTENLICVKLRNRRINVSMHQEGDDVSFRFAFKRLIDKKMRPTLFVMVSMLV